MNRRLAVLLLGAVSACATPGRVRTQLIPQNPLTGPKQIAIAGRRDEVERALEDSLRARGFHVKRYVSNTVATDVTSPTHAESYNEAATRYVLELDWELVDRCFGGGFRFKFINVDVIDLRENETVMSMHSGGYSEKCQPLSGHIFGGIVQQLEQVWGSAGVSSGNSQ